MLQGAFLAIVHTGFVWFLFGVFLRITSLCLALFIQPLWMTTQKRTHLPCPSDWVINRNEGSDFYFNHVLLSPCVVGSGLQFFFSLYMAMEGLLVTPLLSLSMVS